MINDVPHEQTIVFGTVLVVSQEMSVFVFSSLCHFLLWFEVGWLIVTKKILDVFL